MKACSYCGGDCADDAVSCSGCGTAFAKPENESAGGPFRRPPRPQAASIILRTFAQEAPAQLALATLRTARIEAFVATDDCAGLYPHLSAVGPFRLVVSEVHQEAAEQVLADMEGKAAPLVGQLANKDSSQPVESSKTPGPPSTIRSLGASVLGMLAGVLMVLGYQRTQGTFSGTVQRDFNHDGRTDEWDTYLKGQITKVATDSNGDGQPDVWYYYEDGKMTRWEQDANFDGKVDVWGTCDDRALPSQSKEDLDFDGKPDVTHFFQFGLFKESHYIFPGSGLVWKKNFYTNGQLREVLLDRNRDGNFDEKISFDVYGVEVKKEKLN